MTTKVKIKKKAEGYDILVLAKHPMETGNRKDKKTGEVVPAHYITNMDFSVNGNLVGNVHLSQGVSTNPLIGLRVDANSGDTVMVSWVDNLDQSESAEATVK
ncbi:MAG: thiosulfate oxidation carrier complex protein SoxZ [Methylococcales bacterium]|nr:thiosulfate oxidation carrier complex protein SoxZ [Methylococcales bacterium]